MLSHSVQDPPPGLRNTDPGREGATRREPASMFARSCRSAGLGGRALLRLYWLASASVLCTSMHRRLLFVQEPGRLLERRLALGWTPLAAAGPRVPLLHRMPHKLSMVLLVVRAG